MDWRSFLDAQLWSSTHVPGGACEVSAGAIELFRGPCRFEFGQHVCSLGDLTHVGLWISRDKQLVAVFNDDQATVVVNHRQIESFAIAKTPEGALKSLLVAFPNCGLRMWCSESDLDVSAQRQQQLAQVPQQIQYHLTDGPPLTSELATPSDSMAAPDEAIQLGLQIAQATLDMPKYACAVSDPQMLAELFAKTKPVKEQLDRLKITPLPDAFLKGPCAENIDQVLRHQKQLLELEVLQEMLSAEL